MSENIENIDEIDFESWADDEKNEYLDQIEDCPLFFDNLDAVLIIIY